MFELNARAAGQTTELPGDRLNSIRTAGVSERVPAVEEGLGPHGVLCLVAELWVEVPRPVVLPLRTDPGASS